LSLRFSRIFSGTLSRRPITSTGYDRRVKFPLKGSDKSDVAVVRLVSKWIENAKLSDEDVHQTFVKAELKARLKSYRSWGRVWRGAQIGLWLAVALLGLVGSVLAMAHAASGVAIVAGALVGILTTFSQAAHPGRQADGYETARLAMRDEAWALLCETGRYEKAEGKEPLTAEESFKAFVEQIREIVKRKRTATQLKLS
jgi:hypothetical protein